MDRTGRLQRLGRSEAAPVHRASTAAPSQDLDLGLLHERRGYQDRCQDPRGPRRIPARDHQAHHRPAHRLRAGRRPHHRDGGRPHCRNGHAPSQDLDLGRLHERRGHQDRRQDPRGPCRIPARDNQAHHRPAHRLRAGRRPHHRDGGRTHCRDGHARGAARDLRDLPRDVHLAKQDG